MKLFSNKKQKTHYTIPVECSNCGNVGKLLVAKGIGKDEAIKTDECDNCGCKTLKLLTEKEYNQKVPPQQSKGLFD